MIERQLYIPRGTKFYGTVIGHYEIPYPDQTKECILPCEVGVTPCYAYKVKRHSNLIPVYLGKESEGILVWAERVTENEPH